MGNHWVFDVSRYLNFAFSINRINRVGIWGTNHALAQYELKQQGNYHFFR